MALLGSLPCSVLSWMQFYVLWDKSGSGLVQTSKNSPCFWVSSCEGDTEQWQCLGHIYPKAFILSSMASLVKTIFSLGLWSWPILDRWCMDLGISLFQCASWSLGKEGMIREYEFLLHREPRPSRGLASRGFWIWSVWLLMKNRGLGHQSMTLNIYLCFITYLALWEMVPSKGSLIYELLEDKDRLLECLLAC